MTSFRKALSLIIAFAMIFTLMIPAFAAAPSDVVGTNYEDSVGKLVTLGILQGYPDGTFKPDQNITRAEYAKIACYLTGIQAAADLAKGPTKFKDVSASHWASGYINVAAEKGMIKGYPDKTFNPEANVTYAEAITILVRAIGMGDFVDKQGGTWPSNYLSAASTAGLTKNVSSFSGNTAALRGVISELTWNALEADKWGAKEYTSTGITYGPLGKTLLEEQYKDYVYKDSNDQYVTKSFTDVKVVGTQVAGGLDANKIKIEMNAALRDLFDITDSSASDYDQKEVTVTATGIDLNSLFGKKVDLLFGKDNKVANIRVASTELVNGIVDKFDTTDKKVELTNGSKYSVQDDATIYVNTKAFNKTDFFATAVAAIGDSTAKVEIVLDSGSIDTMNVTVNDVITLTNVTMKQFVVKEIKSNGDVMNVSTSSSKQFDIDDISSDVNKLVVIKDGKPAAKSDIKAGDAVTYIYNSTSGIYYLIVSDTKVTGKIAKIGSDTDATNAATRKKLTIDGTVYAMPNDGAALMTKNGSTEDTDVKAIDSMGDFYNKDASVTLNAAGEVMFVNGSVTSNANMQVGVVVKDMTENGEYYNLKLLGPDGVAKTYTVTGDKYATISGSVLTRSDANETAFDSQVITKGEIVTYTVNSDGKIDADNLYVVTGQTLNDTDESLYVNYVSDPTAITVKDVTKKIVVGADTYYANSATSYLNMNAANIEKINGWGNVVTDDYAGVSDDANTILDDANFYIVADKDNIIKTIIISADNANYLGSDYSFGIYVDQDNDADDSYVTLNINGTETRYKVASSVYSDIEKGDLVRFKLNGDGEFNTATSDSLRIDQSTIEDLADADAVAGNVYKIDKFDSTDKIITFKAADDRYGENDDVLSSLDTVMLASNAVVYDVRDGQVKTASISDITSGMYVQVDKYDADNDEYGIIVICSN